jgi:hypothetical protein
MPAGYSGTPLIKKLGIKENFSIRLTNAPAHYFDLFSEPFPGVSYPDDPEIKVDFIHYFPTDAETYSREIKNFQSLIKPKGTIWVSWFKKSSRHTYGYYRRSDKKHCIKK